MLEARECPSVTITEPFQDLNYVEGEQVNLQIAADFTGSNPNRSYSAELPSFLSIDSTTGVISGSVPYQAAQGGVGGVYGIAITATDLANQESDTKSFSWSFANTNQSPSQTSLGDLANYEGDSISISLASGVDPDGQSLTYSIDSSYTLPAGLSMDSDGNVTGSIGYEAAGSYTVTVIATDPENATSSTSFTWTVNNTNRSPSQTSLGALSNNEGDSVSVSLSTGSDPDGQSLAYSIDYNTPLPTGLSMDSAGNVTGMIRYDAAGSYLVTVIATDPEAVSSSTSFTWTVNETTLLPAIGDQVSILGPAIAWQVPFNNPNGIALAFSATGLPTGLTINANTGEVSGAVEQSFSGSVTISLDSGSGTESRTFNWKVIAPASLFVPETAAVYRNEDLVFSWEDDLALVVDGPTAGDISILVGLSVEHGTLHLAATAMGAVLSSGADGDSSFTLTGSVDDLNAWLDGLIYRPETDYVGAAVLSVSVGIQNPSQPPASAIVAIEVAYPPPTLTVPSDFTLTAGQTATLAASASAEAGIAAVEWWVSIDGDDWQQLTDLTTIAPDYLFEHYGEYDFYVLVTDNVGGTVEDGFHVTVEEAEIIDVDGTITVSGPINEGEEVTLTVNLDSLGYLEELTILVDWDNTDDFTPGEDVTGNFATIDDWEYWLDNTITFNHIYDDNPTGDGPYFAKVRLVNERGDNWTYKVPVTVANVAPMFRGVELAGGWQPGLNLYRKPDDGRFSYDGVTLVNGNNGYISIYSYPDVTDSSATDQASLRYHWRIIDFAQGAVIFDDYTTEPYRKPPGETWGKVYYVEGFVEDKDGAKSATEVYLQVFGAARTVLRDHVDKYTTGTENLTVSRSYTQRLPTYGENIFGRLTPTGESLPADSSSYMLGDAMEKFLEPNEKAKVTFALEPFSQGLIPAGTPVNYTFTIDEYDVEQFTIGPDKHELKSSTTITQTSGVLEFGEHEEGGNTVSGVRR